MSERKKGKRAFSFFSDVIKSYTSGSKIDNDIYNLHYSNLEEIIKKQHENEDGFFNYSSITIDYDDYAPKPWEDVPQPKSIKPPPPPPPTTIIITQPPPPPVIQSPPEPEPEPEPVLEPEKDKELPKAKRKYVDEE